MLKAVAFDLDGTLIDSTDSIVDSFVHTFRTLGMEPPPRDRIVSTISVPLPDQFKMLTDHDPDACVAVYRRHYKRVAPSKTFLLPSVMDTLTRLQRAGLRTTVVTSKSKFSAELLLEHFGIFRFIETVIGPEDVTHAKPHPEPLMHALDRLGVQAREMLFVGDTEFDIDAAKAAGVRFLGVATGYRSAQELVELGAAHVLPDMAAICAFILKEVNGDRDGIVDSPPDPL